MSVAASRGVSLLFVVLVLFLASCDREGGRWYSEQQAARGAGLFRTHCAACHGENAQGTPNWFQRDESGNLPPPPLNGTAHAWHHPLPVLKEYIARGGIPLGGVMPAFGDVLNEGEQLAVIAYFQSQWPDETYEQWSRLNEQARE